MEKLKVITNNKNWMESTAIQQLEHISKYEGVISAVGLPDLHAGKSPVGISVLTRDYIYPYIIGNDIGCGMGLFKTDINLKKFKLKKVVNRLNYIRRIGDIETINPYEEDSPIRDLGTIGGGNHFAEFQKVHEVFNENEFAKLELDKKEVFLLVHSGSRSYGQKILTKFSSEKGYPSESEEAREYLKYHEDALLWAKRNRFLVAEKLLNWLGYENEPLSILDSTHNFLEVKDNMFIHRKGATSSDNNFIVIPGSRGTLTYIVKPLLSELVYGFSLSHGAGRKWARSLCKSRIKNKYDRDSVRYTDLKSIVVCHDTELLFQEVPEAYKNISNVIDVLIEYGLIEIVATLAPLVTFKG